jgi:hypothetical protein
MWYLPPKSYRNIENKVTVSRISLRRFAEDWLDHDAKVTSIPDAQIEKNSSELIMKDIACNRFHDPIIILYGGYNDLGLRHFEIIDTSMQNVRIIDQFLNDTLSSLDDVDQEWILSRKLTLVVYEDLNEDETIIVRNMCHGVA